MAASAPPPQVTARWVEQQRSSDDNASKSLELKMSGMSLMSNFGGPPLLNSSVSTSSADEISSRHLSDGIDINCFRGSTPSSPLKDESGQGMYESKSFSRPPGLCGPLPSPARNPGHSKNSSATSAMLTLTPNSSVDGNADFYGLGRQQSPFEKAENCPPVPFLRNENGRPPMGDRGDDPSDYPPGISNFGSFDMVENDGLLGLEALRDRAQSSPGPLARSFESAPSLHGGHMPPHRNDVQSQQNDSEHSANRHYLARPRTVSRESSLRSATRPPLSGGSIAQSPREVNTSGDLSLGGLLPYPGGGRNDELDFGVITRPFGDTPEFEPNNRRRSIAGPESHAASRPEYIQSDVHHHGYNPSRRRSVGSESPSEYYNSYHNPNEVERGQQHIMEHGGHKFGSIPSLSHHLHQQQEQQQRMQSSGSGSHGQTPYGNHVMMQNSRHSRSFSQPGPSRQTVPDHLQNFDGSSHSRYPPGMENDVNPYATREPSRYSPSPPHRTLSGSEMPKPSGINRRSVSMTHTPGMHSLGYEGVGLPPQKRNSQPNVNGGYYGQHPSGMHPSSLHRMDNSIDRQYGSSHTRRSSHEDDLAGEHIEVPADLLGDDPYSQPMTGSGGYLVGESPSVMRSTTSDQVFNHYSGFEGGHHLPTAGAGLPSPKVVYNVKFKRTQRSFVLGPRINRDLKIGTYVKVEADRGEDLGIVVGRMPAEKFNFSGRPSFRSGGMGDMVQGPTSMTTTGPADLKCIIRLATHDEVSLLAMKREEEEELLKICRGKVRQRALPMNVVDAEYQFDRHKLTFFFEAEGRIDFRELVRDLFSMYKTRIWMQQLDKNMTSANGTGQPPPPTNMIDYGTPIIAPASEFSDTFTMNGMSGSN